jgi:hypothetical protein
MIYIAKIVFLTVNASLCWLNNVSGEHLVPVSLLLIDQRSLGHFSGINPCFQLAGGLHEFYSNARGKQPIQRQPLFLQYIISKPTTLSMHNYTPLVISGNDKNKQLTV